jgi:hypothetical protein
MLYIYYVYFRKRHYYCEVYALLFQLIVAFDNKSMYKSVFYYCIVSPSLGKTLQTTR